MDTSARGAFVGRAIARVYIVAAIAGCDSNPNPADWPR